MIKFKEFSDFKTIIENLKNISDTITFYFEDGGINLNIMDSVKISVAYVKFPSSCFDECSISNDIISVSIKDLLDMISFVNCDYKVKLWVNDKNKLVIDSDSNYIEINILEMDEERLCLPEDLYLDYNYKINMNIWKRKCKKIIKFTDNIELNLIDDNIIMNFSGENIKGSLKFGKDEVEVESKNDNELNVKVSLKHICNVFLPCESLLLSTSEKLPLMLKFVFNDIDIVYCIAPRV